jgi:hypothetical protein
MKKLFFLLCMLMSIPATAANCDYSFGPRQEGEWWRPVFTRTPCSRSLKITYKVYFSDGTSDQSRFVYFLSSSFSQTERGSQRYYKPGRIVIIDEEWGDSKGGGSSSGGSSSDGGGPWNWDYGDDAMVAAAAMIAVTAVVGTIYSSNDVYTNWVTSQNYSGFNFGLKNTINRHLDLEIGFGIYEPYDTYKAPSGIFGVDYRYPTSSWSFDLNAVCNFLGRSFGFGRSFTLSPYVGLGFSVLSPEQGNGWGVPYNYFGVGGIAGFSAGFWQNRLQLHARYKWITDFNHPTASSDPTRVASQLELGLSVKYKYGWGFHVQHFDDLEYDNYNDPTIRFGIQAGFSTASTIKLSDDFKCDSRTGYNLMLYMAGKVSDSWAINWGMIGFNSRGFKTWGQQYNFSYIPMSLNVSYQIDVIPEWISLLPFVGLQFGFLTTGKTYDYRAAISEKIDYNTSLNTFNIGPSAGFGIRINNTFEIGMQYDYGLINMFKQKDESTLKGVDYYLRDMQIYTRVFF